jgi:hypothetical protein
MFSVNDLHEKLREVELAIREHTDSDGKPDFDPLRVMAGLELALRMVRGMLLFTHIPGGDPRLALRQTTHS